MLNDILLFLGNAKTHEVESKDTPSIINPDEKDTEDSTAVADENDSGYNEEDEEIDIDEGTQIKY